MNEQNIMADNPESTVIAEYLPTRESADNYQSEAELEECFIRILEKNGYEYLAIKNSNDLLLNLRQQLERLNDYQFSDSEWQQIFHNYIANQNDSILEKTTKIQEDYIYSLRTDTGQIKNIRLLDKDDLHHNHLQVINQYETEGGTYKNRYDVSILVNGLPLVHVELKRRGVALREAFNQINRYQRDSFWADDGLFEFVQLFVISNGTHTKYYSNTTRNTHIKKSNGKSNGKKSGNSFEFTSWWADGKNRRLADLTDFAKTFCSKHTLLAILTKYCVFTTDRLLLVMRPYQIAASETILNKIAMASNHRLVGTIDAGGYIWHTTGSGKTLTSFKTAQIASRLPYIDKVIFVVDRKDLDYQTMKEYDKFQKGAANSNTNTNILEQQLCDRGKFAVNPAKIIITTIQKLDRFISACQDRSIFSKHVVIIFDECHRSQFGKMHTKIIKSFKKYHLFGFTGTPILAANAAKASNPQWQTTEQIFGYRLHAYTIVDAINDENVLPFRLDYVRTIKMKEEIPDKKVVAIDREKALLAPQRIQNNVTYILEHFAQKTYRNNGQFFPHRIVDNVAEVARGKQLESKVNRHISGFNAILAVSSITAAKAYYTEFKTQQNALPPAKRLKIALIYSFGANDPEGEDGMLADEDFDTNSLDQSSRNFLEGAIQDYNSLFAVNYNTSAEKFENYYKDLSMRMKNREIDLLLVVNMFLTGFDAPALNTLWVDKNLCYHGLLQAFSRTNRIFNSVKTFGNIVCFRNLEQATNEALKLFGNGESGGVTILRSYNDYYNGWEEDGKHQNGYVDLIAELVERFPLSGFPLSDEKSEKDFIRLYGTILRVKNILSCFDKFAGQEILTAREFQDYQSAYLDLYDTLHQTQESDKENIVDDVVFEIELVKQITINIDYILDLVTKYHQSSMQDTEILTTISKAVNSSFDLRSKKELIANFLKTLNTDSNIEDDWRIFAAEHREADLKAIIIEENLKEKPTRKLMANAFRDGELKLNGTMLATLLPPVNMFSEDNVRTKKKSKVMAKLRAFFEKYSAL